MIRKVETEAEWGGQGGRGVSGERSKRAQGTKEGKSQGAGHCME